MPMQEKAHVASDFRCLKTVVLDFTRAACRMAAREMLLLSDLRLVRRMCARRIFYILGHEGWNASGAMRQLIVWLRRG